MEWNPIDLHRRHVITALFPGVVVEKAGIDSDRDEIRLLGFDDVANIDELVVPGGQRGKLAVVDLNYVRDDAARDRRDCLPAKRGKRNNAVINYITARLLVFGDHLLEGGIFLFGKALLPPHLGGRGRGVRNQWSRQCPGRAKGEGAAKQRTPRQNVHPRLLPVRACSLWEKIWL